MVTTMFQHATIIPAANVGKSEAGAFHKQTPAFYLQGCPINLFSGAFHIRVPALSCACQKDSVLHICCDFPSCF